MLFFMRLIVGLWGFLCLTLAVARAAGEVSNDASGAAMQYHCAGSSWFACNTNLVTLNKALDLPSASKVEKLALAQVAQVVVHSLNAQGNAAAPTLIEPLLNDLLKSESTGIFGGPTNSSSFLLAVRLDPARVQSWRTALDGVFGRAGGKFVCKGAEGWRWSAGNLAEFWMLPAGAWLLVGRGDEFAALRDEYLEHINHQGQPGAALKGSWLEANLDLARVSPVLPEALRLLKPAQVKLSVTAEKDNLRMTARLTYPREVEWKSTSWQLPQELVRSPLVSFTSGQDVAAYVEMSPAFSQLKANPLTNQFYAWSLNQLPFLSCMAWPVMDASNILETAGPAAVKEFNPSLKDFNGTELRWLPGQKKLMLANLRVIGPVLECLQDKGRGFLVLSCFPQPPVHELAPAELWKQLGGRTNLIYYDWEVTGPRLGQWQMLGRMLLVPSRQPKPKAMRTQMAASKLFLDLRSATGNTVTEITRTAPNELEAVRTGPLGLTGIEMFLLADWLVGWSDHGG